MTSAAPVAASPCRTLNTPGGQPTSPAQRARSAVDSGVRGIRFRDDKGRFRRRQRARSNLVNEIGRHHAFEEREVVQETGRTPVPYCYATDNQFAVRVADGVTRWRLDSAS